ncbi:hypothetical protein Thermo_01990 [Thermoplasmatales archaeon]|nr:hypothetical protein Thermo_01990 [Thermoplasmatales archaeon]
MKWLPKEHGLSISWATSFALSVILAKSFSLWGVILFLLAIPTISVYDPFLVAMRQWKLGRASILRAINTNLIWPQKILLLTLFSVTFAGLVAAKLPLYALVFPSFPLLLLFLLMYKLPERNLATRSASILFVIGQFVLFNSAFTGIITKPEITAYIFLALINVIIIISVRIKIDTIILKSKKSLLSRTSGLSLIFFSILILYFGTMGNLSEFTIFLTVAILSAASYPLFTTNSIRKVGILSSVWTIAALIALVTTSLL